MTNGILGALTIQVNYPISVSLLRRMEFTYVDIVIVMYGKTYRSYKNLLNAKTLNIQYLIIRNKKLL
ncbi:hypothetical protein [Aquimarina hainanensis]|uniref:hypothetical protein n=1 Tax=Aquimarina hainanensis TaxID=1578017 RepID=UPI00361A5940